MVCEHRDAGGSENQSKKDRYGDEGAIIIRGYAVVREKAYSNGTGNI
jgi:hypothetical protein